MTSISATGPTDAKNLIPTSTSGESTSSGGTVVSPTSDKQANDLIMGALNRKSGGGGHLMHKSPSATSLGSTKTTGALAALGMKAMGPGLGGFSAAEPTVVRSQPVGASSFELHRAKTVDFDTSPQKDTGGLFSAFGGTKEKERGRSSSKSKRDKYKIFSRRSLAAGSAGLGGPRSRETSPVGALSEHAESDGESVTSSSRGYRPKSTAFSAKRRVGDNAEDSDEDDASDEDTDGETETDLDYDESSLSHEIVGEDGWVEDVFDEETEKNTEANAIYFEGDAAGLGGTGVLEDANGEAVEVEVDVLGEGPNVIRPPEPVFQQSTMTRRAPSPEDEGGKRKKATKFEPEPLETSRPEFGRNRCTIRMTQGDPDEALEQTGTKLRSYVVLSDLSEEAGYALQWAIGTVARDGDELLVTTVIETDSKSKVRFAVDPKNPNEQDRVAKLRVQKERQGIALQLVRQVTGLLQRTKLNVTVTCQAIHSKNARHMLLDLIDYLEPTMVIVGSRGLGKLQGILLGSTSHYLVQKSSVPVMVARRRLKKPLRKTDPALLRHAPRVSLAGASIEKSASTKQEDEILDAEQLEREGEMADQDKKESTGAFSTAS
ncbi:hypothetical protein HD553DRAFT_278198 [Filobasidium floriforme]|uniref:uncharacterized protein n=1 Tax=Filobasidium floriforme TaxID=5210 RepID=UPI001E8E8148|nr:uncharacterized protein HD553DRAFT_278198 [Filobasidium floriforme]KAH8078242.1 hypothetical protein HD553DRAFT_278198 [Filobasidium floriforme]